MGNNGNFDQYAAFREKQLELAKMLNESSEVISGLNMEQFRDNLKRLGDKVQNDSFKIQVVGTFKNGKSTFINSFLGEEILPAYALPCTAVINEVKWGERKRAVLHFRDPLPDPLPADLSPKALEHMRKFPQGPIPPLEIPYDEIEDYVVIPIGKDPKEMLLESPYEKVELYWPLPLLENGVEIIDSPGLNEHATRTKVTMDYLSKADAILFVLNAQAICSQEEMRFVEDNLQEQGFTDPFFLVNRFDSITSERERSAMRRFTEMKLRDYTSNEIFYVSALNALNGKMEGDADKLRSSGMPEFEARLSDFLTRQKGRVKLSQPARELKRILNEEALFKVIPMQRELLGTSLDDVKERYRQAQPQLADLKTRRDQMYSRLMLRIEQCKPEFRRLAARNMADTADSVPVWIEEFTPSVSFGPVPTKSKSEIIVREISDYISGKMDEQQKEWRKSVLQPIIEEKANDIFGAAEESLANFFEELDSVNVALAGKTYQSDPVPTWQRVVGAVGGLAIGDIGLAFSGGVNGLSKELAKTAAFEFGAGMVLGLLGLFNPVTLIATIVGAFLFNWNRGQAKSMEKLKSAITGEVAAQLSDQAEEAAVKLSESVSGRFEAIAQSIVGAMDAEITETERQIEGIIQEMEKGKENIAQREAVIKGCEAKIKELSSGLDELIFQLVEE